MHKGHVVSGSVEGTGAAITLELGFRPHYLKVTNIDGLATLEWFNGMPDASGIKAITSGVISKILTNGITPTEGVAATTAAGFRIGTDTDINVSGETLHYFAINGDG